MTATEAGFIVGITETPEDGNLRLVYADYLDEKGDAVGAKIQREQAEKLLKLRLQYLCATCRVEEYLCIPDVPNAVGICPDCCAKTEEGHDFKYDRWERDHVCKKCGIPRRCTDYQDSGD